MCLSTVPRFSLGNAFLSANLHLGIKYIYKSRHRVSLPQPRRSGVAPLLRLRNRAPALRALGMQVAAGRLVPHRMFDTSRVSRIWTVRHSYCAPALVAWSGRILFFRGEVVSDRLGSQAYPTVFIYSAPIFGFSLPLAILNHVEWPVSRPTRWHAYCSIRVG